MKWRVLLYLGMVATSSLAMGEEARPKASPELKATLEKLDLPGVKINLDEWSVDVEASVCEDYGLLEVVACVKDTRDHESVVRTSAKPSHIHTALLLLGGKPGSPAVQEMLEGDPPRVRSILPSGSLVDVYLVVKDENGVPTERPVKEFIIRAPETYNAVEPDQKNAADAKKAEKINFPTHTFLFAGSVLLPPEGDGPRRYLADTEGNIISISTFGDEVLCLPDIHDKANETLVWQADSTLLKPGPVLLRLRPQRSKPVGTK